MKARLELLKMRHARILAEVQACIIQAQRETSLGGWKLDWADAINTLTAKAETIEDDFNASCQRAIF